MSHLTLVKNAFANICRGGATAFVALVLPPFLSRILSKEAYGTWLLVLQLSTYISFLDFGIQTAVGRYVAHHNQLGETKERDELVSTALAILLCLAGFAMFAIVILSWQLPNFFKDMPVALHQDAQLALLFVGISLAVALPFSVFGGIFVGLQRYDIPAWIIGLSRLAGGLFVVIMAITSHSIVMMAIVTGMTNIGSGLCQLLAYKRMASGIQFSVSRVSRATGLNITSYCLSLSVWTIGMILVSGLDTLIIGYFDYKSVVYYSLSASLTSFITSIHSSIFGVIMPKAAEIGAKEDSEALGTLLTSTTRYGVIILVVTSLPLLLGAKGLLTLWVGVDYANNTTLLVQMMVIGNFIRYIGAPYATIALAIGEQKQIVLSPVIEGLVNVIISIICTSHYGVIGVTIGTVFGAIVSVVMHFIYNLPRTPTIEVKDWKYLMRAIFRPLLSFIPPILFWCIYEQISGSVLLEATFFTISIFASYLLLWNYAISTTERAEISTAIRTKLRISFVN